MAVEAARWAAHAQALARRRRRPSAPSPRKGGRQRRAQVLRSSAPSQATRQHSSAGKAPWHSHSRCASVPRYCVATRLPASCRRHGHASSYHPPSLLTLPPLPLQAALFTKYGTLTEALLDFVSPKFRGASAPAPHTAPTLVACAVLNHSIPSPRPPPPSRHNKMAAARRESLPAPAALIATCRARRAAFSRGAAALEAAEQLLRKWGDEHRPVRLRLARGRKSNLGRGVPVLAH